MIAHEIGHHVQNLLGIDDQVRRRAGEPGAAATSCRSAWSCRPTASPACGPTTPTSAACSRRATSRRALGAAAAIGDDRLQKQAGGRVNPETWTHGSSQQRVTWFDRGFTSGSPDDCDTFNGDI